VTDSEQSADQRGPADPLGPVDLLVVLGEHAPVSAGGHAVRATALAFGLSPDRATRLEALAEQLAVEARSREAVAGDADVRFLVRHDGHGLHVEVRDRRLPLGPGEARRADSRRLVAMGFADRIRVESLGAEGNIAVCSVDLDEHDLVEHDEAVLDASAPRVSDDVAASVVVRRMESTDALGVARCVYRCYGYSYLDTMMYRPRQMRRALESGVMRSLVAVAGDEVVGHIAMTYEHVGDPVPEGGKLVVDPRFRGHHLAEQLGRARLDWARELGLPGLWAECVTNHVFSQREVISLGAVETGFLVGAQPASVQMQAVANAVEGRHSLIAVYLPVADPGGSVLHVPDVHAPLMTRVRDRLGIEREIETEVRPATGRTVARLSVNAAIGLAEIRVERVGADLVDHLADQLDDLSTFDLAVVHLDLPLADPATGWAATAVERLGWSFGAWLPCISPGGDVLRLQRLAGRPVDRVHVVCARPEGEEVRDHVLSEWHRVAHGHDVGD
jgi:RimJ/RimL family protein N-acetyltransferase